MNKIRATALALLCIACLGALPAMAQGGRGGPPPGGHGAPTPGHRSGWAPPPGPVPRGQWWDGAHGHSHYYPVTGWRVNALPPHVAWTPYHGVRYGYWGGVWYEPYGSSWVVVRPPVGIVIGGLPAFATVVTIGGIGYWYANGVYYREYGGGGYEVVPSPIVGVPESASTTGRTYVYPKNGQSAEKQASDEYDCHRWAVNQTGFDPTAAATGQTTVSTQRSDYVRAQNACLEGRGYTVR
jgi:hypothetical protein